MSGDKTLGQAITAYEAEMKPRGAKEVALSLDQALKARDLNMIKESPIFKHGWQQGKSENSTVPLTTT